ncbi:hypothetical protein [Halobacteriovorax sp. DPLXC-1]|uniref:hypothetical protein n=1 Tax=unclassified Halobacteriovorax TaxID=2639665 RepID=UPI002FF0CBB0
MKYLVFILLFISCWSQKFDLEERLSLAKKIEFNNQYLNKGNIEQPKNTWIKIFEFDNFCAFYKTPFNKKEGILRYVSKSGNKCQFDEKIKLQENISSLKFSLSAVDKVSLDLFLGGERRSYHLFNYRMPRKFSAFQNQLKKSYFDNVFISGGLEYLKDKVLKDGQLCHGVNIECKDVVANICDMCPSGSYEVVDFNCKQGGSKYCGVNKCGTKNQPACPRGYKVLDTKLPSLCFNGSPAGFCEPGLETFCNDDGILVCL